MKHVLTLTTALVAASALPALAEGKLNIYNFGLYTPPDLIEKFEAAHGDPVIVDLRVL
jgi:spermidine/putrescine transport system substrate-binding protein